jgi:hypothetical protein
MTQGTRVGGGTWIYLVLAAVAIGVFALVNAASSPNPGAVATAAPTLSDAPIVPAVIPIGATRLAPRTVRGAGSHCARASCCPTRVRTFGTPADIEAVIGTFQSRGYRYAAPPLVAPVSGDPKTSGTYLRWLGELPGNARTWRQVNVATGMISQRPRWRTVYQVARARCDRAGTLTPPEDWPRH